MIGQQEIGLRIKEAREAGDMTQQGLADAIGVATAQSISRYERGETEVPARRLRKIAEATGQPMSFFVKEPEEEFVEDDRLAEARARLEAEVARLTELNDRLEARLAEQAPARRKHKPAS